jgi:uncharacterized protein YjbJ (UPF0337 family)
MVHHLKITEMGKIMNKNQVHGEVKDLAGKAQEHVGKLVGSKEQQAKGILKQVSGTAEKLQGDAREVIRTAARKSL